MNQTLLVEIRISDFSFSINLHKSIKNVIGLAGNLPSNFFGKSETSIYINTGYGYIPSSISKTHRIRMKGSAG